MVIEKIFVVRVGEAEILELLSMPPKGNIFESVCTCGYVLCINELRVLVDAAMASGAGSYL